MRLNDKPIELNSKEFEETVHMLVEEYDVDWIIETGTYEGTGSTVAFAKTGLPVYTMECVKVNVEKAKENLKEYPNVTVLHGHSLPLDEMYEAIVDTANRSYPDWVRCDVRDPENFYMGEIDHETEWEDLLTEFLEEGHPNRMLVFLDSSGGVGLAEAKKVLDMCYGKPVVLMFDDIDHVKHYYTGKMLETEYGLTVHKSSDERFAWCFLGDKPPGCGDYE